MKKTVAAIFTLLLICTPLSSEVPTIKASSTSNVSIFSSGTIVHNQASQPLDIGLYFESWDLSEYSVATIASTFNMSQSWWVPPDYNYTQKINDVRLLNPNYKALVYRCTTAIYDYWNDEFNIAKQSDWLLKDSQGNYVSAVQWPDNYMVDITNPGYQRWLANKIQSWLTQYPCFDGVMVDGGIIASAQYLNNACNATPINPQTGKAFTDQEINSGTAGIVNAIINEIGSSKVVLVNGIWSGSIFNGAATQANIQSQLSQMPSLTGIGSEGLFYQSYTANWYTTVDWQKSLQMLIWIQDNFLAGYPGKVFNAWVPAGSSQLPGTSEQVMLFGYSSMLLGLKYPQQNTISFGLSSDDSSALAFAQKLQGVKLGSPLGDYTVSDSLFLRDFQSGKVIVNPSMASSTYILDKKYALIDETIVMGSITVGPHQGVILLTVS
jgi:hypothetical protein